MDIPWFLSLTWTLAILVHLLAYRCCIYTKEESMVLLVLTFTPIVNVVFTLITLAMLTGVEDN